jgi:sialic acid synthase SpsE
MPVWEQWHWELSVLERHFTDNMRRTGKADIVYSMDEQATKN